MTIDKIMEYISANPRSINKTVIKGMVEQLIKESKPEPPKIQTEELMVKKNGIYKAPEGKAYSKVIVNLTEAKK